MQWWGLDWARGRIPRGRHPGAASSSVPSSCVTWVGGLMFLRPASVTTAASRLTETRKSQVNSSPSPGFLECTAKEGRGAAREGGLCLDNASQSACWPGLVVRGPLPGRSGTFSCLSLQTLAPVNRKSQRRPPPPVGPGVWAAHTGPLACGFKAHAPVSQPRCCRISDILVEL